MFQKVILIGAVSKEPIIKDITTTTGKHTQRATFTMSTWHSKYNEAKKQWDRDKVFHNIVVWGEAVKSLKDVKLGDYVYVEGEISSRIWKTEENINKTIFEIIGRAKQIRPRKEIILESEIEKKTNHIPTWTPDPAPTNSEEDDYISDGLPF